MRRGGTAERPNRRSVGRLLDWPLGCSVLLLACSSDGGTPVPPDAGPPEASVEIGIPSGTDGLDFAPLLEGDDLPIYTFGQGGNHALLAVRSFGLGQRAFVTVRLTNPSNGAEAVAPPTPTPRPLLCRDNGACDLVPVLVMLGGIAPREELDGLVVEVMAVVEAEDGREASAAKQATISTDFL